MSSLHLIQNQSDPKLLPRPEKLGSDQWKSDWNLSEPTVRTLIGGRVYFHKAQAEPAFLGGDLLAYRLAEEPPYAGRIILVFRHDPAAKGTTTSRAGWSMEKIVFDQDPS